MGNVLAPPAPFQALVLEEEAAPRDCLQSVLRKVVEPKLARMVDAEQRGNASAATVCAPLLAAAAKGGGGPRDAHGFGALHLVVMAGWQEALTVLLEAGTLEIDNPSFQGYTPLHIAAIMGRSWAVQALLQHGASLSARTIRGCTPLHFASQAADMDGVATMRLLMQHPDCSSDLVRQKGHRQRSALLLAVVAHGNSGVVRELLDAGADPNESCAAMASISVLHTCAHLARVDAMRVLIGAGANLDAVADDGISVMHEVFVQVPNRQRTEAAKRQMFKMLVEAGANVNLAVPEKDYSVLHFAMASCREEETADLLADTVGLDFSIGINRPVLLGDASSAKHTLLHIAANHGWTRMVERLVEAGADLHKRNKDGMRPLHSAVLGRRHQTVSALLRLGADPLGTCPDCYPSYSKWKLQRGLQAMQALMQADAGDAMPALMQLFGGNPESGPQMTAVDLACCVARDIPSLEAFIERGVRPSLRALRLAEHAVPIMRAVVERPLWTPQLHARMPPRFRAATRNLLLCLSRPTRTVDGCTVTLNPDALAAVLQQAAFPVSHWADPIWLAAQHVREPAPAPPSPVGADAVGPEGAQPQQAQQQPGAGLVHNDAAEQDAEQGGGAGGVQMPPGFFANVMQQVQQELGGLMAAGGGAMLPGGGAAQVFILPHPIQAQPPAQAQQQAGGVAPAAGAAAAQQGGNQQAGGGAAPGPQGAPMGVQVLQHQQINNGNGMVHVMQFAVELPWAAAAAAGAAAGAGAGAGGPALQGGPGAAQPAQGFVNFMHQLLAGGLDFGGAQDFVLDMDDSEDEDGEEQEEGEGNEDGQPWAEGGAQQQAPPAQQQGPHHDAAAAPAAAPTADNAGPSSAVQRPPENGGDDDDGDSEDEAGDGSGSGKRPASGSSRYNLRSSTCSKRQRQHE